MSTSSKCDFAQRIRHKIHRYMYVAYTNSAVFELLCRMKWSNKISGNASVVEINVEKDLGLPTEMAPRRRKARVSP